MESQISEEKIGNPSDVSPSESTNSLTDWKSVWDSQRKALLEGKVKLSVTVTSPEVLGTLIAKYVAYTVKSEPSGLQVKRRYSDFTTLRSVLIQRYPGLFIASLPSSTPFNLTKNVVSGSIFDVNGEYIQERIHHLNAFLQEIIRVPFLSCDASFEAFLLQDDFKAYIDSSDSALAASNSPGVQAWKNSLESVRVGRDIDNTISQTIKLVESLKSILHQYENQCITLQRNLSLVAKDLNALSSTASQWNSIEEFTQSDATQSMYRSLHTLSSIHTSLSQHSLSPPKLITHAAIFNIQFQLNQLEAFREHLHLRESLVNDLAKAEKEVTKSSEELLKPSPLDAVTSSPGFLAVFGAPVSKENIHAKKVEARDTLQSNLDLFSKGLVFSEVNRFQEDRVRYINDLVGSLLAVNKHVVLTLSDQLADISRQSNLNEDGQYENLIQLCTKGEASLVSQEAS